MWNTHTGFKCALFDVRSIKIVWIRSRNYYCCDAVKTVMAEMPLHRNIVYWFSATIFYDEPYSSIHKHSNHIPTYVILKKGLYLAQVNIVVDAKWIVYFEVSFCCFIVKNWEIEKAFSIFRIEHDKSVMAKWKTAICYMYF